MRTILVSKELDGKWSVRWNRLNVSATVWDRVDWCKDQSTATKAMALARMSINNLGMFKKTIGRGSATYRAEVC